MNCLEDLGLLTLAQIGLVIKTKRETAELEMTNTRLARELAERNRTNRPIKIDYDEDEDEW